MKERLPPLKKLETLLIQGSTDIVDTTVELEFLLKHLNDPVDTLIEKNVFDKVIMNLSHLEKITTREDHKELIQEVTNSLLTEKAQLDQDASPRFRV